MKLSCESNNLADYLLDLEVVDFSHPLIKNKVKDMFADSLSEIEIIKIGFEYVRDSIAHSFDIQSSLVTCKASEVLYYKQGICYAKSNLLAAILRSKGIPTGFCYQRLTKGDIPDTGYCIHALNAVYLKSLERWIRLDARGNKEGYCWFIGIGVNLQHRSSIIINNKRSGDIGFGQLYAKLTQKQEIWRPSHRASDE